MEELESLSFQALFEAIADALLLIADDGRVALANPPACQLLNYTPDQLVGLTVEQLMPDCYRGEHVQHRQQFSEHPEQRPMGKSRELFALTRDGRELPVEVSLSPLRFKSCTYILAGLQDITERKIFEQQYREQRADMESLLKQQVAAQTVSVIAHELNQPLAAISAYSEVALHALRNGTVNPQHLSRALEGCVAQVQRAGKSLHELLNFLQNGELLAEPMELNSVVQTALTMAMDDGYGGFQPVVELEPGLPPVLANGLHVQKVLINLLRNGVEAMRYAGVAANDIAIRVKTAACGTMAQITVQDSGPGLDAETAQRIFDPFFTTKAQGFGLGLAISRALIEANGGQLWLDPVMGAGATFHFTLPFA